MIELLVIHGQQQYTFNLVSEYGNHHVVVPHDSREVALVI